MAKFLFIHGGAHGAWCWHQVSSILSQLGHECYSIDLPGHGSDDTPRAHITRQDYLLAVSKAIDALAWEDITLVGHSLAGMILGDTALAHPQVTRLVYLSSFVLNQGESVMDIIPEAHAKKYAAMKENGDNTLEVDVNYAKQYYFTDINDTHAQLYFDKLTPEPFKPFFDAVNTTPKDLTIEKYYIICSRDQRFPPETAQFFAQKLAGNITTIDGDHCVMLSNPSLLSQTLHDIVTA